MGNVLVISLGVYISKYDKNYNFKTGEECMFPLGISGYIFYYQNSRVITI